MVEAISIDKPALPRWHSPFPSRVPYPLPNPDFSLHDLYTQLEMPIVPLIDNMMRNGIGVDRVELKKLSGELEEKQILHTKEAEQILGVQPGSINLGSPPQVAVFLFEHLGIKPVSRSKLTGAPSTDEKSLDKIADNLGVDLRGLEKEFDATGTPASVYTSDKQTQIWFMFHLLQFRKYDKLKDSYIDKMLLLADEADRIYTTFKQTVVVSGRLSSADPFNFMAFPKDGPWAKRVRKCLKPRPGYTWLALDFSQIEMRVTAHASHDPNMMIAFITDQDIHSLTASLMFSIPVEEVDPDLHRYPAKRVGFGTQFGLTEAGLLPHLPAVNRNLEYARFIIKTYFEVYAKVKALIDETVSFTRRHGYARDLLGRIRYLPEVHSAIERIRAEGERAAFSHFIQGSAQACIKFPMGDTLPLIEHYKLDAIPVIQIHDEMDFEVRNDQVKDAAEIFGEAYANGVRLDVPLKVEVEAGPSWGEMKKVLTVTSR